MCRTGISWRVTPPWLLASMRQLNRSQKSFHRSESWLTIALHLPGYDAKSLGVLISANRKLPHPHHSPSLGRRKAQVLSHDSSDFLEDSLSFKNSVEMTLVQRKKGAFTYLPTFRHHNTEIQTAMMLTLLEILGNKRPILLCVISFFWTLSKLRMDLKYFKEIFIALHCIWF